MQNLPRRFATLAILLLAAALSGCSSPGGPLAEMPEQPAKPQFPAQFYDGVSTESGRVFRVDESDSEVRFFIWRGGPLAEKGHNHAMRVRKMKGAFYLPHDLLADKARLDVVIEVADIEVDPMDLRREIGGAFTGTGMTPEGAAGTRDHMLGEKVLDGQRFPTIGLASEEIIGELPKLVLDGRITIHGISRRQLIPLTVEIDGERLTATGSFVIEQTEFGIRPFTAMGGALYIRDPIMLEFTLVANSR